MFLLICFTLVGFKSIRAFFYNNLKNLFIEKKRKDFNITMILRLVKMKIKTK
jgi:hypothetical protein